MNIYSSVQLKIKIFSYIRIKKSYRKNFPNSIENKKNHRNIQKPIDNIIKFWYNIYKDRGVRPKKSFDFILHKEGEDSKNPSTLCKNNAKKINNNK